MRIFFDTEFTGLRQDTELISIGLISDTGECFYAEFSDYDRRKVDSWVQENVIDNLLLSSKSINPYESWVDIAPRRTNTSRYSIAMRGDRTHVGIRLMNWLKSFSIYQNEKLEMWSDCNAYDWILFRSLLAHHPGFDDLVYYIPFDLCTRLYEYGIDPDIKREELAKLCPKDKIRLLMPPSINEEEGDNRTYRIRHVALYDAVVIKRCFDAVGNISGRHGRAKIMRWFIPLSEISDTDGEWIELRDEMLPIGKPVYVKCNSPRAVAQIIIPGPEDFQTELIDTRLPDGLQLKARLAPGFVWSHWWKTTKTK